MCRALGRSPILDLSLQWVSRLQLDYGLLAAEDLTLLRALANPFLYRTLESKDVTSDHQTFIRLAIPNLFSEENREVFTEEIIQITDKALSMSQQGIISALEGMKIRKDRTHLLRDASFPVFMIIGKKDPALDYLSLLQQATLENIEKVVFDDGHMSHIENQKELISALKYFKNMSIGQ